MTGLRLPADARDLLDYEADRTGRYPAQVVADLLRAHVVPGPAWQSRHSRESAEAAVPSR